VQLCERRFTTLQHVPNHIGKYAKITFQIVRAFIFGLSSNFPCHVSRITIYYVEECILKGKRNNNIVLLDFGSSPVFTQNTVSLFVPSFSSILVNTRIFRTRCNYGESKQNFHRFHHAAVLNILSY